MSRELDFTSLKELPGSSYYLPPEEPDDDLSETDARQLRYARLGQLIDLDDVLEMVCSRLKESAQLRSVIEDAIADPHDPSRPRIHISDALRLTNDVLVEVVTAVDDLISVLDVTTDQEVA